MGRYRVVGRNYSGSEMSFPRRRIDGRGPLERSKGLRSAHLGMNGEPISGINSDGQRDIARAADDRLRNFSGPMAMSARQSATEPYAPDLPHGMTMPKPSMNLSLAQGPSLDFVRAFPNSAAVRGVAQSPTMPRPQAIRAIPGGIQTPHGQITSRTGDEFRHSLPTTPTDVLRAATANPIETGQPGYQSQQDRLAEIARRSEPSLVPNSPIPSGMPQPAVSPTDRPPEMIARETPVPWSNFVDRGSINQPQAVPPVQPVVQSTPAPTPKRTEGPLFRRAAPQYIDERPKPGTSTLSQAPSPALPLTPHGDGKWRSSPAADYDYYRVSRPASVNPQPGMPQRPMSADQLAQADSLFPTGTGSDFPKPSIAPGPIQGISPAAAHDDLNGGGSFPQPSITPQLDDAYAGRPGRNGGSMNPDDEEDQRKPDEKQAL